MALIGLYWFIVCSLVVDRSLRSNTSILVIRSASQFSIDEEPAQTNNPKPPPDESEFEKAVSLPTSHGTCLKGSPSGHYLGSPVVPFCPFLQGPLGKKEKG